MCASCETMTVNGVLCHEIGCPDAYKDTKRECAWCGQEFVPGGRGQRCCSDECDEAYYQ